MKKFTIAAIIMIGFAGISVAQTTPAKKTKSEKVAAKADSKASSDTSAQKHWHKGMKHAKAKA